MSARAIIAVWSTGVISTAACADIIHFTNPAPGSPGHYSWQFEASGPFNWLDITALAASQANIRSGNAVGQFAYPNSADVNVSDPDFGNPTPAALVFGILGWFSYAVPFEYGQPLYNDVQMDWTIGIFAQFNSGSGELFSHIPDTGRSYLMVRTSSGNHGWIEVQRTGMSLSAFSWAYETVPGATILPGHIPTPGTAALLAAAGCWASWRRRRLTS